MSGLLEVIGLAVVLVAVATWCIVVLAQPLVARRRRARHPRVVRARLWLYAPLWVPALVLSASLLPGLVSGLVGVGDHCLSHGHHHHHLCLFHPPHVANHPLAWGLIAVLALPALLVVLGAVRRIIQQLQLVATLVRSSGRSSLGDDVRLLEGDEPAAMTVGLLRPTILLSQGLIDSVSPGTLRVIIAHERAHVARRDTLWAMIDHTCAALFPSRARNALLDEIALATEQTCDSWAACDEGRLAVAEALMVVARLELRTPAVGLSMATSSLEARVYHLLDTSHPSRWWRVLPLTVAGGIAAVGAGPGHNLLEGIVSLLLH